MSLTSTCLNCNNLFTVTPGARGKYCSLLCSTERVLTAGRAKQSAYKVERVKQYNLSPTTCHNCNTSFSYEARKNKFCNTSCAAQYNNRHRTLIITDQFRENQRRLAKSNPQGWARDKTLGHRKITNPLSFMTFECLECKQTFNARKYIKRKYCSRTCADKNNYHPNSTTRHRSIYAGAQMDSGAERLFAELCDTLAVKWHKNTSQYFPFVDSKGKSRKYYPDFYLADYDLWVEIKGKRYVRPDDGLRRQSVGKPVFLIMSNQFKQDFEAFKSLIGIK